MLPINIIHSALALAPVVLVALSWQTTYPNSQPQESNQKPPDMILVPGGKFMMGAAGNGDHSPVHQVSIDSFYMDKCEVTNAQYLAFCEATNRKLPEFWGMEAFHSGPEFPDHPVVGISWSDAAAYAKWAGKRLPTEAEWEYAARGGLVGKDYPGGDKLDSTLANFTMQGVTSGTAPVGSYPANGYGLHDMAGNVVEWVADNYDKDYYKMSPKKNPAGPEKGKFRVIRGGGWHSGPSCCRVYFRNCLPGNWLDFNVGFRCAKDLQR
ncbi:MAG: formylglycine-generating enzyme family protein [Candidatus Neomarinimicrobiota bacterium]